MITIGEGFPLFVFCAFVASVAQTYANLSKHFCDRFIY